jgi:multidrug efflux system outer membrane protein
VSVQIKQLDARYRQQAALYEAARRTLVVSVSTNFYNLLASELNIEILKRDLELKKEQYEAAAASYGRGLASELEVLNAQYAYQTAGPTLNSAKNKLREDMAAFCLLIGVEPESGQEGWTEGVPPVEGEINIRTLSLPGTSELVASFLSKRSDVQNELIALEQQRLSAQTNIFKGTPTFSISESVRLSPGSGFAPNDPSATNSFSLSLSLPISSWVPGYADFVTRKNDKDALASAELSLADVKENAEQDIWKKLNSLSQAEEALESSAMNERIARRAYELSAQGYRAGLVSQTDFQNAGQRTLQAEQAALQSKVNYLSAVYNLAQALSLDVADMYELYGKID